jgi:hypothetical protein
MIGVPGIETLLSHGGHGLGEGTVLVDIPHPAATGVYEDVLAEADAVLRPPTVDKAVEPVQWHLAEADRLLRIAKPAETTSDPERAAGHESLRAEDRHHRVVSRSFLCLLGEVDDILRHVTPAGVSAISQRHRHSIADGRSPALAPPNAGPESPNVGQMTARHPPSYAVECARRSVGRGRVACVR